MSWYSCYVYNVLLLLYPLWLKDQGIYWFHIKVTSCIYGVNAITHMMMSSNGNIVRVTSPLCGGFTGLWWISLTKASDAELWCFLWSAPEQGGGWGCEVSCVATIGKEERPLRGQLWMEQYLISLKYWLSSTQYEQIPIILGVWPFWLTSIFFGQ